ncbi:peroxyredoxin antioxidant [Synechococcus phage S-SRM01]|uniref:Peroxiredoxin n=1 Tax=Synechococcus phage S-SRM01 TaxID=2781608 RepID=A0A879R273_9CAUD|nr:peroxyredoxin antioxidant [Synechococcus phage S-SRM01]QPX48282.1 peroxiredoxin [Synechococcus phage S-SRM01]
MEVKMRREGYEVPQVEFVFRESGEFVTKTTTELFNDKRIIIFSLPGAFTPTCSAYQLPGFEEKYDDFLGLGIDDIYCISVNDGFVMNAWAQDQNIQNVKLIPDGNAYFTRSMGMLVSKSNLGFGLRSWRYAAIVENGIVEKMFVEVGMRDNADSDPYEASTPEVVYEYVKSTVRETSQV